MGIKIAGYDFDGPFSNTWQLNNQSGVYAILGNNNQTVVDVGESNDVKTRVENHDRKSCWDSNSGGSLSYAALYTDENSREKIAKDVRQKTNPPCGER